MRTIELTHKGFHGLTKLALMVPDDAESGEPVEVSERTARRLNDAVCGIDECLCGERVAWQGCCNGLASDGWFVTHPDATRRTANEFRGTLQRHDGRS